jgi:NitT/TauT family transport system substrate-binding protein
MSAAAELASWLASLLARAPRAGARPIHARGIDIEVGDKAQPVQASGQHAVASQCRNQIARPRPSRSILAEDAGISFPSYGLIATEATIRTRGPALRRLVETQQRAWAHLRTNPDDGVEAMLRQRPDARLDRTVTREQIRLTLEFFDTPASAGRPIGWQAEADWMASLRSLEAAAAIRAGWQASNYFTNDLIG